MKITKQNILQAIKEVEKEKKEKVDTAITVTFAL